MKAEAKKTQKSAESPFEPERLTSETSAQGGVDESSRSSIEEDIAMLEAAANSAEETAQLEVAASPSALDSSSQESAAVPTKTATATRVVRQPARKPWLSSALDKVGNVFNTLGIDDRLGRILLSIVLAVLLWFYVTGLENPAQATSLRGLSLDVRGTGSNLKLLGTSPLPSIDISFQAPQNVLSTMQSRDVIPYINLAGYGAGLHRVPVQVQFSGQIGNTISNLSVTPPEVQVQLEVEESRMFVVEPNVIGTPAFGYVNEQAQMEPGQVSVTGSASAINRIASVVVVVDVQDKAGTQRGFKTPQALDNTGQEIQGLVFEPGSVQVTVPIKLVLSNRVVPIQVPIIGNPAPGYSVNDIRIEPTNVMICCAAGSILEQVQSVSTNPVAITGTTATVVTSTQLLLPAGVGLYPGQTDTITVTISVSTFDTTWQMSVTPVVEGLAPEFQSVVSPSSLDLTLSGTFAQFQSLTPTDVRALINVENLTAGTYELTPQVTVPDGIRLVTTSPATVTVSIIAPTPVPPTATNTPTSTPTPVPSATTNPADVATQEPTATSTSTATPAVPAPTNTIIATLTPAAPQASPTVTLGVPAGSPLPASPTPEIP